MHRSGQMLSLGVNSRLNGQGYDDQAKSFLQQCFLWLVLARQACQAGALKAARVLTSQSQRITQSPSEMHVPINWLTSSGRLMGQPLDYQLSWSKIVMQFLTFCSVSFSGVWDY